jgi:hypothetical protein
VALSIRRQDRHPHMWRSFLAKACPRICQPCGSLCGRRRGCTPRWRERGRFCSSLASSSRCEPGTVRLPSPPATGEPLPSARAFQGMSSRGSAPCPGRVGALRDPPGGHVGTPAEMVSGERFLAYRANPGEMRLPVKDRCIVPGEMCDPPTDPSPARHSSRAKLPLPARPADRPTIPRQS